MLADATARLDAAGVDSPRVDAELLLAHASDVPRSSLRTRDVIPAAAAARFETLVDRRAAREPLQHITGTAPFRFVELEVGPGVFVPRPETELLVDAVLPHVRKLGHPTVVDLCAGSGALAVAIAHEAPTADVVAVEVAADALRYLNRNAKGANVRVVAADVRDADALRALYGQVDAVVSNPPYVPSTTDVDPEVRADPAEAVFAGPDGLALMPAVIGRAALLLRAGGVCAVEHDDSHGGAVVALLAADGRFEAATAHRDLAGRPRYATARRNAHTVEAG